MTMRIDGGWIWTGDRVLERGWIEIEDDRIRALGEAGGAGGPSGTRIDASGKLIIPGLINAHTHLYSSLARGMAVSGYAPASFQEILEQLWWRLDKALDIDGVRISGLIGAMEAARCGVTTLIDHHASPHAVRGSLDVLRDAVCDQVGLRASLAYEVSDRDGPSSRDQGIEENAAFLAEHARGAHCSGLFGIHAAFTVADETLQAIADRVGADDGIHIHVAEGPEDEAISARRHGVSVIERLDRFGLLRPRSLLVHCLHVSEAEKDRLRDRDVLVAHNPRSNMNNAVGRFDLDGVLHRGIRCGLGTDGLGANMLGELFTAGLLQKHGTHRSTAGSFDQLWSLLFEHNTEIVARLFGERVGRLQPGWAADLALLDYEPPTPLRGDNVLGHLLFGTAVHSLRVTDLMVAGRWVLRDGRFAELDEDAIYARGREQAETLWRAIG
jgi:putative selenium metabolism protein SsnA